MVLRNYKIQTETIEVKDLCCPARIGVYEVEKKGPQSVYISLELSIDVEQDRPDSLDKTVNYDALVQKLKKLCLVQQYELVETLARVILACCFEEPSLRQASVLVQKPDIYPEVERVGVRLIASRT